MHKKSPPLRGTSITEEDEEIEGASVNGENSPDDGDEFRPVYEDSHNSLFRFGNDDIGIFGLSVTAELRRIRNPKRVTRLKKIMFQMIMDAQDEELE